MTRRDELIQDLIGDDEAPRDHSLRGQSLARATEPRVPRTLTPDEWADWYAAHGVPDAHRRPQQQDAGKRASWMQRLRAWFSELGRSG